jgi:beta-fructofuranosidase
LSLSLPDKWIWDSWYVRDGETVHVYYLHASRALHEPLRRHNHAIIGHAISTDMTHWTVVTDALTVAESPAFDDGTTWTGSIVQDDAGLWWMFYTGTSVAEDRSVQRIGAATSRDLYRWDKVSPTALVEVDPALYESIDPQAWPDEAWRDPWVFRFPGETMWHMLITARSKIGDPRTRGVMGHATSEDLLNWTVLPALSGPGEGFGQLEVFQYEIVDGVPIIIFCCGPNELSDARRDSGERGGIYSLVVDPRLSNVDFNRAILFPHPELYAGRLVRNESGNWNLLAFINEVDGAFVGELSDPIPVTADPRQGLIALISERHAVPGLHP